MKTVDEIFKSGQIYSTSLVRSADGIKGCICIERVDMTFIASWGGGWDHVSVSPLNRKTIPTWNMMCKVKDIFFKPEEAVIQIHPPKDEYVNNMPNCLHLWRSNDKDMTLPPSFMVGLKKGQTMAELQAEIDEYYEKGGYT